MVPFPFLHTHLPFPWTGLAPAPLVHPDGPKYSWTQRAQGPKWTNIEQIGAWGMGSLGRKGPKSPRAQTDQQSDKNVFGPVHHGWDHSPQGLKGTSVQQKHVFGAWAHETIRALGPKGPKGTHTKNWFGGLGRMGPMRPERQTLKKMCFGACAQGGPWAQRDQGLKGNDIQHIAVGACAPWALGLVSPQGNFGPKGPPEGQKGTNIQE